MGGLIAILALDDTVETFPWIGLVPDPEKFHVFFKEVIALSGFVDERDRVFETFGPCARTHLSETDQTFIHHWLDEAFTGTHVDDIDLSTWSMILHKCVYCGWDTAGFSAGEQKLIDALLVEYKQAQGEDAFCDRINEIQERSLLSDWDLKLHTLFGFNYFDDFSGRDPFLTIRFVHEGWILRQFVRHSTILNAAEFPYARFQALGQTMIGKRGGWMPPGVGVCDIRELRSRRTHEWS